VDLVLEHGELDGDTLLIVRGELDVNTAPQLREALVEAIGEGGCRVLVDLEGVGFIDSVGLGMLMAGLKRARSRGADLEIIATGRAVLQVFEITGVNGIMTVHAGREAARRSA
jgi:anti-sigma B factor antagonist